MASFIVMLDLVWFSTLALLVTRARRALAGGRWPRRLERVSGTIMIGLGFRLALKLALSGRGRLVGKPMLLGSAAPL